MSGSLDSKCALTESQESVRVVRECRYCDKSLSIPERTLKAVESARKNGNNQKLLNSDQGGFFISSGGYYYCNRNCFQMYTED
ncbi:hypothetical protein HYW75_05060 [Candidatus Pacearchaeota archaeon]|nr:hypothetical protein [Candidatus Pacearchaeota archaeon]